MMTAMIPASDYAIPTRYSLLSRLQSWDDQESWRDFFDTYWRLIYSIAIRSGLSESEAQDAVQETVISVAKNIHTFKRDHELGSFKSWLWNIIRWRVTDQKRKRMGYEPIAATSEPSLDPEPIHDPADAGLKGVWDEEWQANLFETALQRAKLRVKEEHFQIFHLYAVKRWP